MICGLLGEKLKHSYSPRIHNMLGDYSYELFETAPDRLDEFLTQAEFHGLNVTIPYKKAVIPYCSELSNQSKLVGAVNTLVRKPDGSLLGHNSDYFGFCSMLQKIDIAVTNKKVLILGSGGASATVQAVMEAQGANWVVISRTGENNYENLYQHSDCALIVNTTPVGMYPHNGETIISLEPFKKLEGVMDLIYNPANTRLLQDAQDRGIKTENGLWMLVAQAKESAQWFLGHPIADSVIEDIYSRIRSDMNNLVLIGMPGSGKTTVGSLLAQRLGRKFIDADAYFHQIYGCTAATYIQTHGEAAFRFAETRILEEITAVSGAVISTGGGCVTVSDNNRLLHQNGIVFWIHRSLDKLATNDRPLSQGIGIEKLYDSRKTQYARFSDYQIFNDTTPEDAVNQIMERYGQEDEI